MPPWINKFYILDLPENSFIKLGDREQGYTVFVISWVNPDERLPEAGVRGLHAGAGRCRPRRDRERQTAREGLGDRLLHRWHADGATLAYMAAAATTAFACTFFTAQVDFRSPASSACSSTRTSWPASRPRWQEGLPGAEMATFNMLRANDLIWSSFVVNNYLMGKRPFPFDLLYWNADATHAGGDAQLLPAQHVPEEPAGAAWRADVDNVPIDLRKIDIPVYQQAGKEAIHCAGQVGLQGDPDFLSGPVRFMLAGRAISPAWSTRRATRSTSTG